MNAYTINLRNLREDHDLTQQQVADELGIGVRYYQSIEAGEKTGSFDIWDELEDMFSIHQRELRRCGREANP